MTKTETWRCKVNAALDAECHYGGEAHGCGHWEVWVEIDEYHLGERIGGELHTVTRDTTREYAERICAAMNADDPWERAFAMTLRRG